MRFRWVLLACAVALAAPGLPAAAPASGPVVATAGSPLLRAEGGKFLDGDGREVILRGIAVIKKSSPYLPSVNETDFARIRSWGMNSIRLGTSWGAIEPAEGDYDEDYLGKLAALVTKVTDAGLYVVVDMHQDLWGPPWSNGAPAWATRTDCPHVNLASIVGAWAANYLSPAVMCAFTNFWISEDLQTHYAGAWREVARVLAGNPRIAGYDLMNEPYQGFIPPGVFETRYLYPSQARWLAEIRTVDQDHIGFLESPNYKNVHMPTVPYPTPPANSAYAPHLYGFWDEFPGYGAQLREPLVDVNFDHSVREAQIMGLPLWLGEWGMIHNAPGAEGFARHVYDRVDGARAGASWWEYTPGGGYSPVNADGSARPILRELARAYPQAVPGLTSFTFDAGTSVLEASWSGTGTAVFAVPAYRYGSAISVDTDGASSWSSVTAELTVTGGSTLRVSPAR